MLVVKSEQHNGIVTIGSGSADIEPSSAYLMTLSSGSRRTVISVLNTIAQMYNQTRQTMNWVSLSYNDISFIKECLIKKKLKAKTINTYLCAVKGVLRTAWANNLIGREQLDRILTFKGVRGSTLRSVTRVEHDYVTRLMSAIDNVDPWAERGDDIKAIRDSAMVVTLAYLGLRRAEVVSITMDDYDRNEGVLLITGKGNRQRNAFVTGKIATRINRWIDEVRGNAPGYLFNSLRRYGNLSNPMSKMDSQSVYDMLHTRMEDAGLKKISPHKLRHYFATAAFEDGASIVTVRDLLGHSSTVTTEIYIAPSSDARKTAASSVSTRCI